MSDLINRQAALEAIINCTDIFVNNLPTMIDKVDAQEALIALPSAEPEITAEMVDSYVKPRCLRVIPVEFLLHLTTGKYLPPPIFQPEIIRCKDCVNWDTTWQNDYAPNYHYCPMADGTRRGDFYCADAERRTDE